MVDLGIILPTLAEPAAHELSWRPLAWPGFISMPCAGAEPILADRMHQAGSVFRAPAKGGPEPGARKWAVQRRKIPGSDAPGRLFRVRRSKSGQDHQPRCPIQSTRSTRSRRSDRPVFGFGMPKAGDPAGLRPAGVYPAHPYRVIQYVKE